jgi:hypothetical protein
LLVVEKFGQFAVLGVEFDLLRLELDKSLFQHFVAAGQHGDIESEAIGRLGLARIGAGEPEADVEQLFDSAGGVAGANSLFLMHRAIARRVDITRLFATLPVHHRGCRVLHQARLESS